MNLAVSLDATRATIGTLALDTLSGRARITSRGMTLDPIAFGLFHGRYDGTVALSLGDTPDYRLKATLSGVDVGEATSFAGSPNVVTGKLTGRVDLTGRGLDAGSVTKTTRGTARVDIRDGVVKNLGLLKAVVVATSMRADARPQLGAGSTAEPFSRLGATFRIANGTAATDDLLFESPDLSLAAAGSVGLDGSAVALKGRVQLSDGLSKQAGRDLVRYMQEQGRVTLPATVTGSAANLSARIDVAEMVQRAIRNRASEEAQKLLKGKLGGLFR